MLIDVSPLVSGEKNEIKFDFTLPGEGLGDLGFGVEVSELHVGGSIKSVGGCMFLNADEWVSYSAVCDRCLKPLQSEFAVTLERTVGDVDDEDSIPVENSCVNADEVLYEEMILSFPQKFLCTDSCRGLCPTCGKDLNEGDCSCKGEIDPRLAPLLSLLQNEEDN